MKLIARGFTFEFPRPSLVMGIVNLVADSFSGDGITEIDAAIAHALDLVSHGADIVDIGAESARTNREALPAAEEAAQLVREYLPLLSDTKETLAVFAVWRDATPRLRRPNPG